MAGDKQSANQSTVFKTREIADFELPANPKWETREPNSFSDFGGQPTAVARKPFSPSRQRKKGSNVDLDVTAGWSEDLTQNNMQSIFDGFFYANLRTKPKQNGTAVAAATDRYTVAAGANFAVGSIILAKGFRNAANNGVKVVTESSALYVGVGNAPGLVDEAGATGTIEVVGFSFPAADVALTTPGGVVVLTSAAMDFTTFGLIPGEWVVVGADAAGSNFGNNNRGYARIAVDGVQEETLTFDKTTFAAADTVGAGITLQLFFGVVVKNEEDPDLIVKLTDRIERPLGRDDDGRMSETITGATPNELTFNSPLANLVTVDVGYIGMKNPKRKGVDGLLSAEVGATLAKALGEDAFNTSSNLFRCRMSIIDEETLNPTPLFGKVTEWTVTINNNVQGDKAQGVYGSFDTTEGTFEVDGEFTAYFKDLNAGEAIDDNADVTFDAIYSKHNAAFILDLPLVSLGDGRPNVEQDAPIMLPLTTAAAESPFGHTALVNWLSYVPNYANATG